VKKSSESVTVPFAGEAVPVPLPATWKLVAQPQPKATEAIEDLAGGLRKALDTPIGCESLAAMGLENKRIVLAVDDISRPTPLHLYFGDLVEYLIANGASKEKLLVLTGLGIHRAMSAEEVEHKLGKANLEGLRWVNHDCSDMEQLVDIGTTSRGTVVILNKHLVEADLIICVGAIEPHLLLGFGGGLKMIIPGLAHQQTVAQNHMQGVTPTSYNYVGVVDSPMRLDLEEGAGLLGKPFFIVNAIMNETAEICRFVCGDPIQAHRDGARQVAEMYRADLSELADVVVVAANPMNKDLRQSMKCIGNVEQCLKPDGLIVALMECREGIGDVSIPPKSLPHGLLRFIVKLLGRDRVLWFVDKVKKGAGTEERFMAHYAMQVIRKTEIFAYSPHLPPDTGKRMGLFRQFGSLDALWRAAATYAPPGARVYVFSHGGVSFYARS